MREGGGSSLGVRGRWRQGFEPDDRSGPEPGSSARGGLGCHGATELRRCQEAGPALRCQAAGLPSCAAGVRPPSAGRAAVVAPELEQLAAAGVAAVANVPPLMRRELARLRQLRRVRLREPRRALRLRPHDPS